MVKNISAVNSYIQVGLGGSNNTKRSQETSPSARRSQSMTLSEMGVEVPARMRTNRVSLSEARTRGQESVSMMQTAESVLGKAQNMLRSMQELAARSASANLPDIERLSLDMDYSRFKFEICDLSAIWFNGGRFVSPEERIDLELQVDIYSDHTVNVSINALDMESLGDIKTAAAAESALAGIGSTLDDLSSANSQISDARNQLIDSFSRSSPTTGSRQSNGRVGLNSDTARQVADAVRNTMMQRTTAASAAHADVMSQGVLQLV